MKYIKSQILSRFHLVSLYFMWSLTHFNGLSIKPSGTHQWYQSRRDPPTMVAHTLSKTEFYQWMNESLAKLESQLQTLLNEFRSIRTAWEAPQTNIPPTSVFALALPLPSATTPPTIATPNSTNFSQSTTVLAFEQPATPKPAMETRPFTPFQPVTQVPAPPIQPTLKPSLSLGQFASRSSPKAVTKLVHAVGCKTVVHYPFHLIPLEASKLHEKKIQITTSTTEGSLISWVHIGCEMATNEDEPIMGFAHGGWRPSWRPIDTAPNATGKIMWQLPWRLINTFPNADRKSSGVHLGQIGFSP
ncbi:hypothetical protein Hanom_Chr09g00798221 [Helianthus anomalus]